jgi:uncharacterized protein YfiM (DUF2279 family)
MKVAGMVFLLAVGISAVVALWTGDERAEAPARSVATGASDQRVERFERELQQTRSELAHVRRELAELQHAVRSAAALDTEDPPVAAAEAAPVPEQPAADSDDDYLGTVADAFDAELSDPRWQAAADLRPKLTAALPAGSVLRSLDCRTSMCRVETTHANHETYRAFTEHFSPTATRASVWSGAGYFHVTHAPERPGDALAAVVYLGRESLPTAEPPR